jgi:hypothetical protein
MDFFRTAFALTDKGYVLLSNETNIRLGKTFAQIKKYLSRRSPDFIANDLRIAGDISDPNLCMIHKDDLDELCRRIGSKSLASRGT